MLYKFKSKAAGDLIMLQAQGDSLLRAIGREPAAQGIIEPDAMPAVLEAIQAAIANEEAERTQAATEAAAQGLRPAQRQGVALRARLWPMVEMLRRAQAAGEAIVWGV